MLGLIGSALAGGGAAQLDFLKQQDAAKLQAERDARLNDWGVARDNKRMGFDASQNLQRQGHEVNMQEDRIASDTYNREQAEKGLNSRSAAEIEAANSRNKASQGPAYARLAWEKEQGGKGSSMTLKDRLAEIEGAVKNGVITPEQGSVERQIAHSGGVKPPAPKAATAATPPPPAAPAVPGRPLYYTDSKELQRRASKPRGISSAEADEAQWELSSREGEARIGPSKR